MQFPNDVSHLIAAVSVISKLSWGVGATVFNGVQNQQLKKKKMLKKYLPNFI